jgi:hypothetical protein
MKRVRDLRGVRLGVARTGRDSLIDDVLDVLAII